MHSLDWSELKYILAVAQEGSASKAARLLNVNHSTVVRHIQQFETQHNVRIFDHLPSGYRLTEHGAIFLEAATTIGEAVIQLNRKLAIGQASLSGTITITTTDSLYALLINPIEEFRQFYPGIKIELITTNNKLDLNAMEADIALRPSISPPEHLVKKEVGNISFGVYASKELSDQYRSISEAPWLGLTKEFAQTAPATWMEKHYPNAKIVMRGNSFASLQKFTEAGLGFGILLTYFADQSNILVKRQSLDLPVPLWLLTHKDFLQSKKVTICLAFLEERLKAMKALSLTQ